MPSKVTGTHYKQKSNPMSTPTYRNAQRQLADQGLEVGLAYATEHMPGDVRYLDRLRSTS